MNLRSLLLCVHLCVFFIGNSQIDTNRCFIEMKEDFSPRVFQFSATKFLSNEENSNTLFLQKKQDFKIFSEFGSGIATAVLDPKEMILAISFNDNTIKIYNSDSKEIIATLKNEAKSSSMLFYKDHLYFALDNGQVQKYTISSKKTETIAKHQSMVRNICLYQDKIISVSINKELQVHQSGKLLKKISFDEKLTSIAVSQDYKTIAIGTVGGNVFLLNNQFETTAKISPHTNIITKVKFKDNNTLLSSSFDKTLAATNMTNKTTTVLHTLKDYIMTFDIAYNKLIFSDRSGNVRFFNLTCR